MITELIYQAFTTVIAFLLDLIPSITLPTWLTDVISYVNDGVGPVLKLGYWIPFGAIGQAATFVLTAWGVAWAIRGGRMTLSVLTGGGGSAG